MKKVDIKIHYAIVRSPPSAFERLPEFGNF